MLHTKIINIILTTDTFLCFIIYYFYTGYLKTNFRIMTQSLSKIFIQEAYSSYISVYVLLHYVYDEHQRKHLYKYRVSIAQWLYTYTYKQATTQNGRRSIREESLVPERSAAPQIREIEHGEREYRRPLHLTSLIPLSCNVPSPPLQRPHSPHHETRVSVLHTTAAVRYKSVPVSLGQCAPATVETDIDIHSI